MFKLILCTFCVILAAVNAADLLGECCTQRNIVKENTLQGSVIMECAFNIVRAVPAILFNPFNLQNNLQQVLACTTECFGKKLNAADENGTVIPDQVKKEFVLAGESSEVAERTVDACMAEIQNQKQKKVTIGCNPDPMNLIACVIKKLAMECPENARVNSARCNRMRADVARGDNSPFIQHSLQYFLGGILGSFGLGNLLGK